MNNKFRFFDPISNCFINPIIVGGINEFLINVNIKSQEILE